MEPWRAATRVAPPGRLRAQRELARPGPEAHLDEQRLPVGAHDRLPVDALERQSPGALADFVMGDRSRRLSLERVDGQPVVGSDWEPLLVEMGFRPGPRKLTLSA